MISFYIDPGTGNRSLRQSLRVLPSQANCFMVEVRGGTARDLAVSLLDKDQILIKVLTGKRGIRGERDNERLVRAITSFYGEA